jgi:hypothetical protein
MMTKGEFLNRFQRQPDGAWCCKSMDRAATSLSDRE